MTCILACTEIFLSCRRTCTRRGGALTRPAVLCAAIGEHSSPARTLRLRSGQAEGVRAYALIFSFRSAREPQTSSESWLASEERAEKQQLRLYESQSNHAEYSAQRATSRHSRFRSPSSDYRRFQSSTR